VNWAILRGEAVTGNTMMLLDAGTDTGDIVDQQTVPITPDDTCATVYAKVGEAGAEMLRRQLPALLAGTAPRRPQGSADGPPLPKRTPGMGITDWNRPARAVHDWIRALTWPYPGAFTFLGERKVMLWAAIPDAAAPQGAAPGEVLGCDDGGVRVATADGTILLTSTSDVGGPGPPAARRPVRAGAAGGRRVGARPRAQAGRAGEVARWRSGRGSWSSGPTPTTSCSARAARSPGTCWPVTRCTRSW
jgi:methionyl-tRNA formyltransferase